MNRTIFFNVFSFTDLEEATALACVNVSSAVAFVDHVLTALPFVGHFKWLLHDRNAATVMSNLMEHYPEKTQELIEAYNNILTKKHSHVYSMRWYVPPCEVCKKYDIVIDYPRDYTFFIGDTGHVDSVLLCILPDREYINYCISVVERIGNGYDIIQYILKARVWNETNDYVIKTLFRAVMFSGYKDSFNLLFRLVRYEELEKLYTDVYLNVNFFDYDIRKNINFVRNMARFHTCDEYKRKLEWEAMYIKYISTYGRYEDWYYVQLVTYVNKRLGNRYGVKSLPAGVRDVGFSRGAVIEADMW